MQWEPAQTLFLLHFLYLPSYERLTYARTYLYQNDEWALPGDFCSRKFISVSQLNLVSHTTLPTSASLCLQISVRGSGETAISIHIRLEAAELDEGVMPIAVWQGWQTEML